MRNSILIAGTALALSASSAEAGGSAGRGSAGASYGLFGGTARSPVQRSGYSLNHCLCSTAATAVKGGRGSGALVRMPRNAGGGAAARMPRNASGAGMLVNSVVGLNGFRAEPVGHRRGVAQAVGLAGTIDGTSYVSRGHGYGQGYGRGGAGLAGTVNVAALNDTAGSSGRLINVSLLNAKGPSGRSAVNVAVLNGSAGSNGSLVNVATLNGTAGSGVAHGSGHKGSHSGGQVGGFRVINGIPCSADGTPLTGARARAARAAMWRSRHHASPSVAYHGGHRPAHTQDADDYHHQGMHSASAPTPTQPTAQPASYTPPAPYRGSPGGPSDYDRRWAPNKH